MSTSLTAVAVALLVLVLLALTLGAGEPAVLDDGVVLELGALVVATVVTGALVPLAALPDPLTVAAFTVVEPEAVRLPEPVFVAPTVVVPVALVVACMALVVAGAVPAVFSTGAVVPLAAVPEPTTVAAFKVVEPAALTAPVPLLVALTVVEPVALVIAVWAIAELPNVRPRSAALTAAATVLLCCSLLVVITLLSVRDSTERPSEHNPETLHEPMSSQAAQNGTRDDNRGNAGKPRVDSLGAFAATCVRGATCASLQGLCLRQKMRQGISDLIARLCSTGDRPRSRQTTVLWCRSPTDCS